MSGRGRAVDVVALEVGDDGALGGELVDDEEDGVVGVEGDRGVEGWSIRSRSE